MKDYFSNPPQPIERDLTWANEQLAKIEQRYGELTRERIVFNDGGSFYSGQFEQEDHGITIDMLAYSFQISLTNEYTAGIDYWVFAGTPVSDAHLFRVIDLMLEDRDIRERAQS